VEEGMPKQLNVSLKGTSGWYNSEQQLGYFGVMDFYRFKPLAHGLQQTTSSFMG
jgi:hypothetical protein